MREILLNTLLFSSNAQARGISQPTFTTDIDFSDATLVPIDPVNPTPIITPPQTNSASITLDTLSTLCDNSNEFEVDIKVDTKGQLAKSVNINLIFDSSIVIVIDQEAQVTGSQIEYLGSLNVTENLANNNSGSISLKAEIPNPKAINETIAKVYFRAISTGDSKIEAIDSTSSILTSNNTDILTIVTNKSIVISPTCIESVSTIVPPPNTVVPGGTLVELPKSDLPFAGIGVILIGIGLVYIGQLGKHIANNATPSK